MAGKKEEREQFKVPKTVIAWTEGISYQITFTTMWCNASIYLSLKK